MLYLHKEGREQGSKKWRIRREMREKIYLLKRCKQMLVKSSRSMLSLSSRDEEMSALLV